MAQEQISNEWIKEQIDNGLAIMLSVNDEGELQATEITDFTLKGLQTAVGGYIEPVTYGIQPYAFIGNEEARYTTYVNPHARRLLAYLTDRNVLEFVELWGNIIFMTLKTLDKKLR